MATADLNFNIFFVFFIYGLAFFSMGLALMLEAGRSPFLAEARPLRTLAFFGLVHGSHEWLEVLLIVRGWLGLQTAPVLAGVRLFLLVVSFAALFYYGLQVLGSVQGRLPASIAAIGPSLLILYFILLVATSLNHLSNYFDRLQHADALARYLIAIPGALLAALALYRQAQQAHSASRLPLYSSLRLSALGLGLYGLSQAIVTPVDLFPGNVLNSTLFLAWTGIPVQAIRALLAVVVTVGMLRAIQVVEVERQLAFVAAQQARVDALEQVQHDLEERAALRRELLRHIVIAQEDERARIARELHDETSQFLTVLSLDLATLKKLVDQKSETIPLLDRLQLMSRKMSDGVYRMVRDLRPAQLDDLGLVAALQYLLDESRREGVEITLQIEGERQRLDPLHETVFFRVAQEAVTNIIRHAGCARGEMKLCFSPHAVTLMVKDEGAGFDINRHYLPPRGWGLEGMRERAESAGGDLHIVSQPGRGTQIELTILIVHDHPHNLQEDAHENDPVNAGG